MVSNREEWLLARKQGIGGSDAAAVLGLSKYKTPFDIYEDKLGLRPPTPDNNAMKWGRNLEPLVRAEYANQNNKVVVTPEKILTHPKYNFILANLDGYTEDNRIVEIKTSRYESAWGDAGTDQVPIEYILQVQHYMLVTGFDYADIAVLISGSEYRQYEIKADQELHEMMIEQYIDFWASVQNQTPPEPSSYTDAIARYGRHSVANTVTASVEHEKAIQRLSEIKLQKDILEKEEDELKGQIMVALGDNDTLVDLQGKALCTWKLSKPTSRFDSKSFEKDYPDLYAQYKKIGEASRRFLLK